MNFVTPKQYSVSNQSHFIINTKTINQLVKFFPPLSGTEKVKKEYQKKNFMTNHKVDSVKPHANQGENRKPLFSSRLKKIDCV